MPGLFLYRTMPLEGWTFQDADFPECTCDLGAGDFEAFAVAVIFGCFPGALCVVACGTFCTVWRFSRMETRKFAFGRFVHGNKGYSK